MGFLQVLIGYFLPGIVSCVRLHEIVVDIAIKTPQISFVTGYQIDAYRLWFPGMGVARSGGSVQFAWLRLWRRLIPAKCFVAMIAI
jgi:hypothetical protein